MKYLLILIFLLASVAYACADIPAHQTPETQGLDTVTMVQVLGLATESDSLVWQGSSYVLDDPPLSGPPTATPWIDYETYWGTYYQIPSDGLWGMAIGKPTDRVAQGDVFFWDVDPANNTAGEVQYVTSYNEDTMADSGLTSYSKSVNIDTRNKVANQENFDAEKIMSYIGSDTGAIASDESLLLDTAGQYGWGGNLFNCPFAAEMYNVTPQFCNIEEMGSSAYMQQMQMTTSASDRFVAASADTPVAMDYEIIVTGIGDAPALGDVTAYMNSHSMEGRIIPTWVDNPPFNWGTSYRPGVGADVVYNEETTARGAIYSFQKDMSYISGIRR